MTVQDMDICLNISADPAAKKVSERLSYAFELLLKSDCSYRKQGGTMILSSV